MTTHIAFVRPDLVTKIRQGTKTVESRLGICRPLAWSVQPGDTILFKEIRGEITLSATVIQVHRFETSDLHALAQRFGPAVGVSADDEYWQRRVNFAVFIELTAINSITFPPELTPRGIRAGWVKDFRATDSRQLPLL